MPNNENFFSHYLLDTWYIFQPTQHEINQLRSFLDKHPSINLEFNISGKTGLDVNRGNDQSLTAEQLEDFLVSSGIEPSRVRCGHLTNSDVPMFRLIR
jgi:hypothetical protein